MRVKVGNTFSNDIKQLSGVPQGSVLGPVCFVLFINNLPNTIKYSHIKLYADDVKIYFCFKHENWSNMLQLDLNSIAAWAEISQLN